jgi:heptosyltransferase II
MKILVRGANWIGDAVMTIPALRELRRLFPDDEITLYTRPWAEGVFRDAEFIDRIVEIKRGDARFKNIVEEAKRLRAEKYDLAVLFPNSFESAVVVRLAGIPRRFGYSRDGRGILLTDPIKPPKWKDERHQIHYYLNIVAEIERRMLSTRTVNENEPVCGLTVSDIRQAEAAKLLEEASVDTSKPIVAFGTGSTNSMAKRWGEERFAELGAMLQNDLDANVILLGSKDEVEISSRVSALSDADLVDLTGKTSLAEVTAILARADLFVSNDMGLAHISAAVGTKTVVIFGPTNDVATRPFGINAEVIRHDVECSPCMLRECPIDHRCMTRIGVDAVFARAEALLDMR